MESFNAYHPMLGYIGICVLPVGQITWATPRGGSHKAFINSETRAPVVLYDAACFSALNNDLDNGGTFAHGHKIANEVNQLVNEYRLAKVTASL
jgi:hypothetical protein